MQWRSGVSAVVMTSALMFVTSCSGGVEGTANTAPIREETTVPSVVTLPVTTAAAVTTSAAAVAVSTEVAVASSTVPTPVGDDYRVPVIVKFVPTTDEEREVLAAATELLVQYRRLDLRAEKRTDLLNLVLTGEALVRFGPNATIEAEVVSVPSDIDRVVINSVNLRGADFALVDVCQVDGASLFVRAENGDLVFDNSDIGVLSKRYEIVRKSDGWRVSTDEVLNYNLGPDECAS